MKIRDEDWPLLISYTALVALLGIVIGTLLFGVIPSENSDRTRKENQSLQQEVTDLKLNNHLNLQRIRVICERAPQACENLE